MTKREVEAIYPLSPQQLGMLYETLSAPNSGIHIEQKIYFLRGKLNASALEQSWQHLVDRHTVLRTAFVWQTRDEPLQVVLRGSKVIFERYDCDDLSASEQQDRLSDYLDSDRRCGFDLSKAPLMRLALFKMSEDDHRLVWTSHHIILDGWCRPIIDREVKSLYEGFTQGRNVELPPTRPYRDYIAWIKKQDQDEAEQFWRKTLKGITRPTPLGVEAVSSGSPVDRGYGEYKDRLPASATTVLKSLCRRHHLTLNTVIQAVWALLQGRYSGERNVVFGTTISGRPAELENVESMVGLFINTLPLPVNIPNGSFWPWLEEIQNHHLELRRYEYCSSGQIHQWSEMPGSLPLYESILVFENYPKYSASAVSSLKIDSEETYSVGAQTGYALNLLVTGDSDLEFYLVYDRSRLAATDTCRLLDHLLTLLTVVVSEPNPDIQAMMSKIPLSEAPRVRPRQIRQEGEQEIHEGRLLTPTEQVLAQIWSAVLGVDRVGVDDNFFELKGHSLLAAQVFSRVREAFSVELSLRSLFESPTISTLAARIEESLQQKLGGQLPPLLPVSRDTDPPLSFAQQRLWFLNQLQPDSPFYNTSFAVRLTGRLDSQALEQALNAIVARHEALRTVFGMAEDNPVQVVLPEQRVSLQFMDLSPLQDDEREPETIRRLTEEANKPFDLARGPLFRTTLVKLGDLDHVLLLSIHHIVSDRWSLAIVMRELQAFYESYSSGKVSPLPELRIQYADYAVWQRSWLQGERLEREVAYWRNKLKGAPLVLELPSDRPRPPVQSFRGAKLPWVITGPVNEALGKLSRRESVTLFMALLAAFQLLLSRYTGRDDVVVGTDLANRNYVETEDLIGFFVNLLPIRTNLAGNPTFLELLGRVREGVLEAYTHQNVPFEKLVEELRPERDLSRNPLVQVLFVMQNTPRELIDLPGLAVSPFELDSIHSRFDLALFVAEREEGVTGLWVYDPDLFERERITRISNQFERLLAAICQEPSARLDTFHSLTDEEVRMMKQEKQERQESQLNKLRATRRRGVVFSELRGVKMEFLQPNQTLPLVIRPDADELDLAQWTSHNQEFLNGNLLRHGALLFRGFDVDSVAGFETFASAICPELFGEYGDLPREELGGKVYGSTPYPADETILFHNESSHMHRWPMLIWFYCVKAAERGGESPIVDCRRLYEQMNPAIREEFKQKDLLYVRNFTDGLDVSWQNFFHTSDRVAVEDYCRKASIEFEWKGDTGLRTRQRGSAVVRHPQTGETVFFNQLQLHHVSCLSPEVRESLLSMLQEEDLPRNVYYGDGSRIDASVMSYLGDLYRELAVSFPWQERDVLMLNNMLVAHSRNPFAGERKIVVALGKLVNKDQIEQPALLNQ